MKSVVFITFTRGHGRRPGLIKHGFIDVEEFKNFFVIPESCVYADIYQRQITIYHSDKTVEHVDLDYWGFAGNLFDVSREMKDLEFPFQCNRVINCVFSEYE